jgi:uncharacterized phage protein gp47/JayE
MADTPIAYIDETGCHVPEFNTVYNYYANGMRGIFGDDIVLDPATMDGQWVAFLASGLNDLNANFLATYNAFSPATAQGTGLSSNVKLNGLARKTPSYSTVPVVVGGEAFITITDGVIADPNTGQQWLLPSTVIIPAAGEIEVTATCKDKGAVTAPAGSLTSIVTITRGWQTVTNPVAATPGAPVELDAQLRVRQALSTSLPAQNRNDSMRAALLALPGVARAKVYDNDLDIASSDLIPPHTVAAVVQGGVTEDIAQVIMRLKGGGIRTIGNTLTVVYSDEGVPRKIRYDSLNLVQIAYYLTIKPMRGFTVDIKGKIQEALVEYTNNLDIGESVLLNRASVPANLFNNVWSKTYELMEFNATRDGLPPPAIPQDVALRYNEAAQTSASQIIFNILR